MITLYLFITFCMGLLIVNFLRPKAELVYKVSIGFLFGIGISSFVILILNYYGYKFNRNLLFTSTLSLLTLSVAINLYKKAFIDLQVQIIEMFGNIKNIKLNYSQKIIITFLILLVLSSFAHNLYWPVHEWDSLALYDYRGKVLSESGNIFKAIRNPYDITHPPLTSVMHGIFYELGWNRPAVIYTLMYLLISLFTINFIKTARYFVPLSLLFMLYYYPSSISTYSNFPYMVYSLVGFVSLYQYISSKNKKFSYLLTSSIAFAISVWIRQGDHLFLIALVINLIFIITNRGKYLLHFIVNLAFIVVFYLLWDHIKVNLVTTSSYVAERVFDGLGGLNIENLGKVVSLIYKNSIYPNILFIVVILSSMYLNYKKTSKFKFANNFFFLVMFGHIGLLTVMLFVFSGLWGGWEVLGDSIYRMSNFYLGLMVLSNITDYEY